MFSRSDWLKLFIWGKKIGKEDILILGDSTSQSLWLGIDVLAKKTI